MSSYQYYDDLSGESSDGCRSSSDESDGDDDFARVDDDDDDETMQRKKRKAAAMTTAARRERHAASSSDTGIQLLRTIVHADVDCFYCQCEILDRGLDPERPLAIGQKHIVVTCNYAARAAGVTKLMGRDEAQRRCPHLLVVDGSDLERYRVHGRKIYEAFRRAFQRLRPGCAVCKGSMDEMMADLTIKANAAAGAQQKPCAMGLTSTHSFCSKDIYIYGNQDPGNAAVTMTEDQSGARTVILQGKRHFSSSSKDEGEGSVDLHRLLEIASIALQARQAVFEETGFTITMGVSFNPLMAKLASGLRKPGKVNLLQPSSSSRLLVESMPLRKIPGIGSRTMKVLVPCLVDRYGSKGDTASPWTCRDLLRIPRNDIIRCLEKVKSSGGKSSAEQCSTLLQLCIGQDISCVVDDRGGLQKTLSVENSFRRGTIRTKGQVLSVMEDLYRRLPRLLKDRKEWSNDPMRAYPTTIRLTVRHVVKLVKSDQRRLPVEFRSKQMAFNGRSLIDDKLNGQEVAALLRQFVSPLLHSLVLSSNDINVTKLNIGLTNFQDLPVSISSPNANQTRKASSLPFRTGADTSMIGASNDTTNSYKVGNAGAMNKGSLGSDEKFG